MNLIFLETFALYVEQIYTIYLFHLYVDSTLG